MLWPFKLGVWAIPGTLTSKHYSRTEDLTLLGYSQIFYWFSISGIVLHTSTL